VVRRRLVVARHRLGHLSFDIFIAVLASITSDEAVLLNEAKDDDGTAVSEVKKKLPR
jgi:hypothetical protein